MRAIPPHHGCDRGNRASTSSASHQSRPPLLIPLRAPPPSAVPCAGLTAHCSRSLPAMFWATRDRWKTSRSWEILPAAVPALQPTTVPAPLARSLPATYPSLSTPRNGLLRSIRCHWRRFIRPPLIFAPRIAPDSLCSIGSSGGSNSNFLYVPHFFSQTT